MNWKLTRALTAAPNDVETHGALYDSLRVQPGRGLQASQCEAIGFVGHTSGIPGGNF